MLEFLRKLISFLENNNIPYMLSGSIALSIYSTARSTRDFDFVTHLQKRDVNLLAEHFKEGYYCDRDSIEEAISTQGMFNIIDHQSAYKADFIILKNEPFRQVEFERRRRIMFGDIELTIVSPEDLLLSKLIWIQVYQSPIQMEDIVNLNKYPMLDREYVDKWVGELKLSTFGLLK